MAEETSSLARPPFAEEEAHSTAHHLGARITWIALTIITVGLALIAFQRNSALADAQGQLARANTAAAETRADLTKATAQADDLQSQLSQANAHLASAQAQARSEQSDLRSQLDQARTQATALQSQLAQAGTRSAELQARLARANEASSQMSRDLDAAKSEASDAQAQLVAARNEIAQLQPAAAQSRALPVVTSFKRSFWGGTFSLQVTNRNSAPLTIAITASGPKSPAPKSATIDGGSTYGMKGLPKGTNVTITADGYDPLNLTVP